MSKVQRPLVGLDFGHWMLDFDLRKRLRIGKETSIAKGVAKFESHVLKLKRPQPDIRHWTLDIGLADDARFNC